MKFWRWSETIGSSWLSALPQNSLQLQKPAQQLVRMSHVAATFAMGLNDPTPAKGHNGTAGARVLVGKRREQTVDFSIQ